MAFFIPLLAQGARMIATQGIKKAAVSAVKKKAIGAVKNRAKNFVTGKGKKRKGKKGVASKGGDLVSSVGGGLVKSGSVGSNFIPKGGALVKSPSGSLSTGDGAGGISFEAMSTTLDSIVSLTSQIENIVESQYKNRKAANQEARKEKDKGKKKIREEELESKKKKPGSGLLGKVAQTAKGFSLGGFLMNILMGGVALALFKSWGKIKKLFDFLGKKLTSFWDMLRYTVIALSTAFRKPTKWVVSTAGKILKKGGNLLKNAWKSIDNIFKGGLTKLSNGIKSWGQSIWKKLTSLTTSSAAQGAKGASRATGVGKRGFKGKGANNIVPGPKNLSKVKPTPKSFTQAITKSTGTKFQKSGLTRLAKVSKVFKRIPVIGALLGIGIDLALGERLDNAIFGALGASLGAWIGGGVGSLIFPLLGTAAGAIVGGMIGDWLGKELYKTMSGQISGLASGGPQNGEVRYNKKGEKEVYNAKKNEWVITPTSTTTTTTSNLPPAPQGALNVTNAKTTYYDPSLGGINASGHKTADGLPATSTGEGYRPEVFSAAAFPPLIRLLPSNMTTATQNPNWGGIGKTIKRPFNVIVTNSQNKTAIVRVNDVGPGVDGHAPNHMLDLSVAAKDYFGTGEGFSIQMAPSSSTPGPVSATQASTQSATQATVSTQVPKPGDGTFEGQIKKVQSQNSGRNHGPKWFKWKIDGNGKGQWWSQTGVHAVQAQKDYTKQQLAPPPPQLPPQSATQAEVTSAGQTTTSDHLKKGDKVSGFEVVSPHGPRNMSHSNFHGGIDIGTPVGTYVAFTEDAEILYCGHYGGYGYLIDAWLPAAGIQLRLAHLSKILVNKGDKIPARTPVGRTGGAEGHPGAGTSTGPHLHIEANTKKGSAKYGGSGDPSRYVKYLILSKTGGSQVTPSGDTTAVSTSQTPETGPGVHPSQQQSRTEAQIQPGSPQARQSASAVSSQASYERGGPGGNVVVSLPGGGQVQGKVVGGGRQGGGRLIVDPGGILNSYYKAQLLGFLYKQG